MRTPRVSVLSLLLCLASLPTFAADKIKPEEIVQKHLEALGPVAAREAKERGLAGPAMTHFILGGTGELTGKAQILSRGNDVRVLMSFNLPDYPGEDILCSSGKVNVAFLRPGIRSQLGQFLFDHPEVLKDGLFGGALSTAWPLLTSDTRGAKLSSDGLKTINGVKLLEVKYTPKHFGGDNQILLFFDPESYRHVMTRYTGIVRGYMSGDISRTSGGNYPVIVEERFSEFADTQGLMLPRSWTIRYTTQTGGIEEWKISFSTTAGSLDDKAFGVQH